MAGYWDVVLSVMSMNDAFVFRLPGTIHFTDPVPRMTAPQFVEVELQSEQKKVL